MLRRMSARELRSALREFFAPPRRWTPADVLRALDHEPGGTQHIHSDAVRSPADWLASRLAWWRDSGGAPVAPHSARLAERAELERGAADRERAWLRNRRPGADPAPYATLVRAELARLQEARRGCSGPHSQSC